MGRMRRKKKKGETAVDRSSTQETVYQIREILQGLFSERPGRGLRSREIIQGKRVTPPCVGRDQAALCQPPRPLTKPPAVTARWRAHPASQPMTVV
jgi:hypothetical protein